MNAFSKITLALLAGSFIAAAPALAADSGAAADALKSRTRDVIGDAQQGIDENAAKIRDALDAQPKTPPEPRVMDKADVIGAAQQGTDTKGAIITDTVKDKKADQGCPAAPANK